ncbi:hypothetical protein [Streptomyces sp. NPDC018833]|uniref:hypothetical protein n=1 Tax=Streptomyces sp. NPDC018833 TaxID=3365053 RepID=UPI00379D3E3D
MRMRYGRAIACLVVSAVAGTMLPQVAYAAPVSSDNDKGIVDSFAGWFSEDEDEPGGPEEPSTGGTPTLPSREKLPKGKTAAKPKRVAELTARRTANARYWQLSDGRVQTEVSAVPTGYRSGKSWKDIDPTVTATGAKGYAFGNTTNAAGSWFGSDARRLLRFEASGTGATGRKVSFLYTQEGLLGRITDGDGSAQPKVFKFRYDATQGNKNAKLVEATDPRGNGTSLDYYYPSESDDPKDHWRAQGITDHLDGITAFDYVPNTTTRRSPTPR